MLCVSDTTSSDEVLKNLNKLKKVVIDGKSNVPDKEDIDNFLNDIDDRIQNIDVSLKANYDLYTYFCEKVLAYLLIEDKFKNYYR
jgi:hypothetical protein